MSLPFSIVVAQGTNREIGRGNKLPWRLKGDMENFKKITTKVDEPGKQNAVIMGRKTWISIPEKFRPLADRVNIVVSSQMTATAEGGLEGAEPIVVNSLTAALKTLEALGSSKIKSVFVIGGSALYEEAIRLPNCRSIYLTQVNCEVKDADVFFPEIPSRFVYDIYSESNIVEEGDLDYYYTVYNAQ